MEQIKHVPDSRKSFPTPLRPTENQYTVRLKVRRILLAKIPLVLHRRRQIIYINTRTHVLID